MDVILNPVQWRVGLVLFTLSLITAACADNPTSFSRPTSTPSIYFIQQQPVHSGEAWSWPSKEVRKEVAMTGEAIGQLVVINGCLRLNLVGTDISYVLVWPPEFSLDTENAEVQVFDGDGQVAARLGEEVYVSGGEVRSIELLSENVRQQLPPGCLGPYWMVGLEARPNMRFFSRLVTLDVIETADRTFFFIRKKPGLDEWAMREAPLRGELALFGHCLCVVSEDQSVNYTPIWPPDYQVRLHNGDTEIVNGLGQVVTRVGEAVHLEGGKIPVTWDLQEYQKLRDDLPGECKGPYWIVRE